MENIIHPIQRTDDDLLAFYALFVYLICVECSKEPEFRCKYCDRVYKQEGRYQSHIAKCIDRDTHTGAGGASDLAELLRQNREMMAIMQKQQETIHVLVSHLSSLSPSLPLSLPPS